ncbi:MAG TPA: cyclase family protein [Dongiaceae bacterium]|nr:cyclase family protein [Dongiaceae bacterium]
MYETWREFAERVGAAKHGVAWPTAHCLIVLGDHAGTHMDSLRHMRADAPGPEGIPLEYCYAMVSASIFATSPRAPASA